MQLFPCIEIALVLKSYPTIRFILFSTSLLYFLGCAEDDPKLESSPQPQNEQIVQKVEIPEKAIKLDFPTVYIEELDQSQEFFKEQHETSFSFVNKKNWFSYSSEKKGVLTKVLLFGKPNYKPSDHYGDSMHGFIRKGNPDKGPKLGEWRLSRDDIINQILAQGLSEREAGWITIRMRGEIPQEVGQTYFFVCDKITGGKPWFGAFAFGEGNPYKPGRFWLQKDHDLVFRTYIGKTPDQVALEQKNITKVKELGLEVEESSTTNANPNLDSNPISQTPKVQIQFNQPNQISKPQISEEIPTEKVEELNFIQAQNINSSAEQNNTNQKSSLFNRLFKKE